MRFDYSVTEHFSLVSEESRSSFNYKMWPPNAYLVIQLKSIRISK